MTDQALTIHQSPHLMPAMSMADVTERFKALTTFTKRIMTPDVDFGTVPGTNKPTLLKPGAEKLTTFFGLTVHYSIVGKEEDWTGAAHGGEPFFYYWFRCALSRGDLPIAEADGSCNSMESKYRWRWVSEEDIPFGADKATLKARAGSLVEFVFAIDKAETAGKYGKPAEYWQAFRDAIKNGTARATTRTTRAGKELPAKEIDSTVYRVPNEDIFSQVNTVKKMAQKRALVAATLLAVNASEFFTQDLEDLDLTTINGEFTTSPAPRAEKPKAKPRKQSAGPPIDPQHDDQGNGGNGGNGNNYSPERLFTEVNEATTGAYNAIIHLNKTLKKELKDEWTGWPPVDDIPAWERIKEVAIKHAKDKQAA